MSEAIIFEQPLNERIRTFMRLEFLFKRVQGALAEETELHHRHALHDILNILNVCERSDLKQEVMKEIERLIGNLSALENAPGIDKSVLTSLLNDLDRTMDALYSQKSGIGQTLKENDFLYSIRQRASIAGGSCEFDLPAYHFWLQHNADSDRTRQLMSWLDEFTAVKDAVTMSLNLIRNSVGFKYETAEAGFFQRSLDSQIPFQLIRVEIPSEVDYFPEISGGKHRFTVRFMQFDINQRPQQINANIQFKLSCCAM